MKPADRLLMIISFLLLMTRGSLLAQDPTSGLIAWYPFNGNVNDSSGNGFNGNASNAVLTADRFNHSTSCYSFDGSSSYIDFGQFHPSANSNYSISYWMKAGRFRSVGGYGGNNGMITDAGGALGTWFYQNDSVIYFQQQGSGEATTKFSLSPADTSRWIHVVGVYAQGTMRLYRNGIAIDSLLQSALTPSPGNLNFEMGRDVNLSNGYWSGLLDEVRIYNRALNPAEISALYHTGGWGAPNAPQNLAINSGNAQVALNWSKNTEPDFLKYRVYMGADSVTMALKDSTTSSFSDTSKLITGLTNGSKYFFRVSSLDSVRLESGESFAVYATPEVLNAQREYNPDTSTALLLHMDESSGSSVSDASGHGNNGTATGTASASGKFGNARSFNGTSDYVNIQSSSSLSFSNQLSMEAYINFSIGGDSNPRIIQRGSDFVLYTLGTTATRKFGMNFSSLALTSSASLNAGTWYHVVGTYDGATARLYINGKLDTTASFTGTISQSIPIAIGRNNISATEYFSGLIDEVRISNKARSPQEFNLQIPPIHVNAVPDGATVNLSWQNGGGEIPLMRYKIYRGLDSTNVFLIDSTTSTTYPNLNLTSGNAYYYRISAVDSTGFESAKSNAASAYVLDLAGWYPFNGTVNDSSGNGNNGTATSIVASADRFNKPGRAYQFNGSTSEVLLPNNFQTQSLTFCGWYDVAQDGYDRAVFMEYKDADNRLKIGQQYKNNMFYGYMEIGGVVQWNAVSPIGASPLNKWNFACLIIDAGKDSASLFVNDILQAKVKMNGYLPTSIGTLTKTGIGHAYDASTDQFVGNLDDIRIYNRALSASEVHAFFVQGGWPPPNQPQNLAATAGNGQVTLKWGKNSELDFLKYKIYMGLDSTSIAIKDSSTSLSSDTSKIITGLTNGIKYYFRVSALDTTRLESGLSAAVVVTPVPGSVPGGLVAWYPLNGNVNDSSIYGNNGTNHGALLANDRFNTIGGAYIFDGVNAYLQIPRADQIQPGLGSFSISGWFKINAIDTTKDDFYFLDMDDGDSDYSGYSIYFSNSTRQAICDFHYDDVYTHHTSMLSSQPIPLGHWHFFVGVLDRDSVQSRFYIDTVLVASKAIDPQSITSTNSDLYIGRRPYIPGYEALFNGSADDIRIYNRIMNQSEIDSLYHVNGWNPTILAIDQRGAELPREYQLVQNYPNPFNPSTRIQYALPHDSRVKIVVYNVLGQEIARLVNDEVEAGYQTVVWNANVASGVYFYRIEATAVADPGTRFVQVRKMLLLK